MKILDNEIDLWESFRKITWQYRWWLLVIVLTQAFDAISTMRFMSIDGTGTEFNPVVRVLSDWVGIYLGPIVGKALQLFALVALGILTPKYMPTLCAVVATLNLIAAIKNTMYANGLELAI